MSLVGATGYLCRFYAAVSAKATDLQSPAIVTAPTSSLAEALEVADAQQIESAGPLLTEHLYAVEALDAMKKSRLGAVLWTKPQRGKFVFNRCIRAGMYGG